MPEKTEEQPQEAPKRPPKAPAAAPAVQQDAKPKDDRPFEGYLAEVVDVVNVRTGIYGEIKQAMCKILEGKDKGRVIRRNLSGRVKVGDILRFGDTSREDKPINVK